jgi:hypothetical protein
MAAIDNFKNALRAGNFEEAFVGLLSKAVEFSITTWVVSDSGDSTESEASNPAKPGNSLRTRINLLEGEINNEIDRNCLENGLSQELQQFHLEQVAKGNEIIEKNLESVEKLIQLLATFKQQKSELEDTKLESLPIVKEITAEIDQKPKFISKKTAFNSKMTFLSAINIEDESETGSFKLKIEDLVETDTPAETLTEVAENSSEPVSFLDLDLDFSENTSTIETEEEWTDIFEEFEAPENVEVVEKTDEGKFDFQAELEPSTIVAQEETEWDGWTIEELEADAPNNQTAPVLDFNTAFEQEFEEWIESDCESLVPTP